MYIILAHENDPELGGCEFGTFFRTTPQAYAPIVITLMLPSSLWDVDRSKLQAWASFGRILVLTMVALLILYRFHSTSQDLISDGLYARVAVAFHTGQHRMVSLCLLAQEIIKHTSKSPADKVVDIDRR